MSSGRRPRGCGLRLPAPLGVASPPPVGAAEFVRAGLFPDQDQAPQAPAVTLASDEPVAIVGMGCRYPGGAASPEEVWDLLAAGVDTICELPADRGWNGASLYDPDPGQAGTSS